MRSRSICSVFVALATALVCASTAAALPYVYASAWDSQRVDEYTASVNGTLHKLGSVDAYASNPWYMAMTANLVNHFTHLHLESLFMITYSGNLISYAVGANGKLAHKAPAQGGQLPAGSGAYGIALSPDDKNAYVPDYSGGTVSVFDVLLNGGIKAHSPATVSVGTQPDGVAVSPNGTSVYVAEASSSEILQFNRSAKGSLTPKNPPSVAAPQAGWISLTPNGKHLYVANYNDSTIGVYNVAPSGTLTQQSTAPTATSNCIYEMAVTPNGKGLYAADNCDGKVYQYTIAANGSLLPKSPPTKTAGVDLDGIWLAPSGRRAYVANGGTYVSPTQNSGYNIAQFNLGSAGLLSPISPPFAASDDYPAALAIPPDMSPRAAFTVSGKGLTKVFDGSGSTDPDGFVTLYRWSFGDGSVSQTAQAQVSHPYKHAGTYTARLTVTDNAGCSVSMIWTGQMAYCDGNKASTITHSVTVK